MSYVVGLTVRVKDGCPVLRGVVLDEQAPSVANRKFVYSATKGADPEVQLHSLAESLAAHLTVQPVRAAALLEAGFAARAGLTGPNKHRLRAEGVALNVLRSSTSLIRFGDKRLLGLVLETDGAGLVALGATVVADPWAEAACAALVATRLR